MKNMIIRKAQNTDIDPIIEINNSYLDQTSANGFLVSPVERADLINDLASESNTFLVAESTEREITGFVKLSDSVGKNVIKNLDWLDEEAETKFASQPSLYIEKAAIGKPFANMGIGNYLYQYIFETYTTYILYCFIVEKPVKNTPSLNFHVKLGFNKYAIFKSDNFLGFKNYQSVLLARF